jgi:putative heme-binding domain-containing protein
VITLAGVAPLVIAQESAPTKRVLVYTVSAGYEHEVAHRVRPDELSIVEKALVDLGRSSNAFEAVPTRDAAAFEPQNLSKFDAVFFYTTGDLPLSDAQRAALFAFVEGGGGFAGAHCATDTLPSVPEYGEMIGARFDGHPWHQRVLIVVEDVSHAATRHLGPELGIADEIYQFTMPFDRARMHVLLSLDTATVDLAQAGVHRADRDFALCWTKPWGKGRVFYTALGHQPDLWKDERFLKLVDGGLRWSMHAEERPALSKQDQTYRDFASSHAGDAAKGFELFRRESGPMCFRCHRANGAGGDVGPDLSGVARRLAPEEILDAVLAPSTSIERGYAAVSLELTNGLNVFGRILKETDKTITMSDTNGLPHDVPIADVVNRTESHVSVMPDGLARTLSQQEFADLYAYVLTLKVPAAPTPTPTVPPK